MTENIIPLRFNCQQVGKHVKGSKKRFTWQVSLNSKQHIIILDFSFISGKVKVTVDRKVLLQNQLPTNTSFQYPFTLDGNALNVIQQGDNFQLRINNKVFSHLYNQMKTNKQFKKYQDEIKDFNVNENQFQAKKLVLNIGGIGNGMKKKQKQENNEEHNWNAFGQNDNFPSYFQNQSISTANTMKIEQKKQKKSESNLLLLDDEKKQSQNILDFQVQIQKSSSNTPVNTQQQKQFHTMQMMFSTMNMGIPNPTQFQSTSKPVIIDNNQVDFFNQPSSSKQPQPNNNNNNNNNKSIDFFSLDQPISSSKLSLQSQNNFMTNSYNNNQLNYGTGLHQMFATSNNNNNLTTGFQFNNQNIQNNQNNMNFSTNVQNNQNNTSKPFALLQGFGLDNGNKNINLNTNNNSNSNNNNNQNVPQNISTQGFETTNLGMLFSTNNNIFMNNTNNNTATNNMSLSLNQTNFSTGINMNNQNNQNNMNTFSTGINMNNNITNQINLITSTQPTAPQVDINKINMNDYNSMQMLFQTNTMGMNNMNNMNMNISQPLTITQTTTNIKTSQLLNLNQPQSQNQPTFQQSFNTTTGVISPNMLGMNTYSGGNINNLNNMNFNLNNNNNNINDLSSQFATSININNKNNINNINNISFQKNKKQSDDLI